LKTIILVRHGQSETNVQKVFTGQLNAMLTPMGIEQAERMARYVAQYPVEKVYASSLQRAVDTAAPICRLLNCPIETTADFWEIDAGAWQGLSFEEVADRYPDSYALWRQDFGKAHPDGGESCKQVYDRVVKAFCHIVENTPENVICIVSHAIPIRMIESYIGYGSVEGANKMPWAPNASVTVYDYDGTFHMRVQGVSDFLEDLQSNLPKTI
jgi:probable phosphoglycerate mutase